MVPRPARWPAASFSRQEEGVIIGAKTPGKRTPARGYTHYRVNNGSIPLARKEFAMAQDITMTTSRASLCALGEYLRRQCFFAPVREQVQIRQKTVRYRPVDKLLDALSGMLC